VTLNREHERHSLISADIVALKPDVVAFNEVSVPL